MTHYIADVGVFGHTMGSGTDWGAEVHHSDYEQTMDEEAMSHALPGYITASPLDPYNATLQLARDVTFGHDPIRPNVWMDSHYNWSDTAAFVPSAFGSLDEATVAVGSAIAYLIAESGAVPSPSPDNSDQNPPANQDSNQNTTIVVLTALAMAAVSGLLLIRRGRRP
jgi:hypothetical protein